jgi:hypothetical protein
MFADRLTYNLVILFTNNLFPSSWETRQDLDTREGRGRVALRARWEGEGIGWLHVTEILSQPLSIAVRC